MVYPIGHDRRDRHRIGRGARHTAGDGNRAWNRYDVGMEMTLESGVSHIPARRTGDMMLLASRAAKSDVSLSWGVH